MEAFCDKVNKLLADGKNETVVVAFPKKTPEVDQYAVVSIFNRAGYSANCGGDVLIVRRRSIAPAIAPAVENDSLLRAVWGLLTISALFGWLVCRSF